MKRKLVIILLSCACILSCAFSFVSCGNRTYEKAKEFVRVSDGVFSSAGYTSPQSGKGEKASVASAKPLAADGGGQDEIPNKLTALYNELATADNTRTLDEYHLNYLKGDALFQGANLAGLFKSMAQVLGDEVFGTVYDMSEAGMQSSVAKLEKNDGYTLYGVMYDCGAVASAIRFDFAEYASGKFIFKLVQYDKLNDVTTLSFSYYDSESTAFAASLEADKQFDYTSYDDKYSAFKVTKCKLVEFDSESYLDCDGVNTAEAEMPLMKFAKEQLGYNNATYAYFATIGAGKSISDKDLNAIGQKVAVSRYVNPYINDDLNNVTVRAEYRIPEDVTEVARASIPATKKLIVPAHVTKILDAALKYPQYLEEVVFEDPDNGSLVQIGNDDDVFTAENGDVLDVFNLSKQFLISYTKVKNFVLPKTVKKIAGPIYIATDMDTLDLSSYHPDYDLFDDGKTDNEGYTVSLYTTVVNRENGFYKELGHINKLYVNKDFWVKYHGDNEIRNYNPDTGKMDVYEYESYNKTEDKYYAYSPTREIYKTMFALAASGQTFESVQDYANYVGWTETDVFIDEIISTGMNAKWQFDSELYARLTLKTDVDGFAAVYAAMQNDGSGKISVTLTHNGQPKTEVNLYDGDGTDLSQTERAYIKTPNGEKFISDLTYKEVFYAPKAFTTTKTVGDATHYFVGWSFSQTAETVDVLEGETVVNYYQNMYAVYLPATEGVEYVTLQDGNVSARINGTAADLVVIADSYEGKSVTELQLGNYKCKKIIFPDTVGCADSQILYALADGVVQGLRNITRFSDMENGLGWLYNGFNSSLLEKLKECASVVNDNGLYYLKNNRSNYFMLFAADADKTGQVYISNMCSIVAVEFGDGVTDIVMPDYRPDLRYISYLKFKSVSSFSIPNCVTQIEYVAGEVRNSFTMPANPSNGKINVFDGAFENLEVTDPWISVSALTADAAERLAYLFNAETRLFLDCEYADIAGYNFQSVSDNMYFYSEQQPNFDDYDVALYNYWHYDGSMKIAVWERPLD